MTRSLQFTSNIGCNGCSESISQKEGLSMKSKLQKAFDQEMLLAKNMYKAKDFSKCYYHLERAHILGQRHYLPHVLNHFWMFKVAVKKRDLREALGQISRMIMSVGSIFGVVPLGNTGRARISPIKPMPIPSDLQVFFE